jgi:branched-chain amino acid transport system ATP-binding protein
MSQQKKGLLLNVEKLEVIYHNVSVAVQGVSLEVKNQQIVTLLGTNGAGKTTILRAISGFLGLDGATVTEGSIRFNGKMIQHKAPHLIARKGIVLVPERDKIFANLTAEENLQVSVALSTNKAVSRVSYDLVYYYFPQLAKLKNRLGGYLSGGERQMLSLAAALLCRPRLLLVDELSLGLAPIFVAELMNLVRLIRDEQQITVLVVEQNALAALEIADFGYVIENGRIVFAGDAQRLKSQKEIQEFYLGRGERESMKSYRDVKQYRHKRRWYG